MNTMTARIDTPNALHPSASPFGNDLDRVGLETEVTLPNATMLLEGRFLRAGGDLVITAPDGTSITVEGYFDAAVPPILTAPNGALLLPETIIALSVIDPTRGNTLVAGPTMVAAATTQTPTSPPIGKVGEMLGTVMAKGTDGVERILKEGDSIYQGEVLQTQKGGLVKLAFPDGTTFQLGEAARAVLDKFIYDPDAKKGGFEATVTQGIFSFESGAISGLNAGRHSMIKTPTSVIGIRGSQLSGEVMGDGSTTVVHTAGILDISDARGQGTVTLIEPGTATQVVFGAGAPEPVFKAPANFISRLESQYPNSGASYVIFGRAGGFSSQLDLSTLDGSNGFRLDGAASDDWSGYSVSNAGDVNGDGFDDLIVGAGWADPGGNHSGASDVIYGKGSGFTSQLNLSALNGGNGFRLDGVATGDLSGYSVSGAGDINGDGFDDLLMGATYADAGGSDSGASYLFSAAISRRYPRQPKP
ncbi:MAG: FG-GAP repeat protein [Magnetococcales bacterium]|nr:FG-GAP repeat protein [Magnetococcales bacterium]